MKRIQYCWYCHLAYPKIRGEIIDKNGCCKRCGTNLRKYPTLESHRPPDFGPNDEKLTKEVLGYRKKFVIPPDEDGEY